MLSAVIRPIESRTIELNGESGDAIRDAALAQMPEGWVIDGTKLKLDSHTATFNATVTITRRDGLQTIEAADRDALHALVPEGWQMLSVRRA